MLDGEKRKVKNEIATIKDTWHVNGVSIISDRLTNVKNQPLINVLAANKDGAMFFYVVDVIFSIKYFLSFFTGIFFTYIERLATLSLAI